MKAVNAVTMFFLNLMMKKEQENPKVNLVDVAEEGRRIAKDHGADDDAADEHAKNVAHIAVCANVAFNLQELVQAVAKIGKVMCGLVDPDMVESATGVKPTVESLRAEGKKLGGEMVMLLTVLNELLPAVQRDVDEHHIAEVLLETGKKLRADKQAEDGVKAKPVSGTAVPFGKRIEPSQN